MRTILLPALLLAGGLTATAAGAQTTPAATPTPMAAPAPAHGGKHHGSPMMAADTNHDGVVTKAELTAESATRFDKMDTNHDGSLSAADGGKLASKSKTMTKAAFTARAGAMFDRADTNHDGKLDSTELAASSSATKGKKMHGGADAGDDSGE